MSMRLNTPIGSSLQYTDAKIRDAEAAIREIPGVEASSRPSAPTKARTTRVSPSCWPIAS